MAEEGLIDKAIGLIPGIGGAKPRKRPPDIKRQVAQLQRGLLKLTEDVEHLGKLVAGTSAKPADKRRTAGRRRPKATQKKKSG
jgi:hypothetical protein